MQRVSFNENWQVRPKANPFAEMGGGGAPYESVRLPHDAMIGQERRAADDGHPGAYFPGGVFEYRKSFPVSVEDRNRRIVIEFEGAYRDALVYINGDYAGQRPYGYSTFRIQADPFLRFGEENEIRVETRAHRDSRWYTGAGLYRDIWLLVGELIRTDPDGLRVSTVDLDQDVAVVEVATTVLNDSIRVGTLELGTQIRDGAGELIASGVVPLTVLPGEPSIARQHLLIHDPQAWSPEQPSLYTATATLTTSDGTETDRSTVTFGIRTLSLDPERGLRINGRPVKLRGACLHHDNGLLGTATIARAEQRRVEILKQAGFNAIRMSHHPMSTAMLDACDRLGVLVMDEAFDLWTQSKSDFDYSLSFPEWWERDLEAMVAKDVNHPSVIMYSIGNEIPETGTALGAAWGRRLAEKVRSLDSTRYVTNAVNGMLSVMTELMATRAQAGEQAGQRAGGQADQGGGINTMMARMDHAMNAVSSSELVTRRTAESFSVLDVAGMNYAEARYAGDRKLFPQRVIVGAETFPTHIEGNWRLVLENSHVIGDFTWTGWEYLGEVGIGRPIYLEPMPVGASRTGRPSLSAPYPQLIAGTGDIDITGHRRPVSYYREIVYGLRKEPYVAVERPEHHGREFAGTPWAWRDGVASWNWPGFEQNPVRVEVYSPSDEVELLVNGTSLGRRTVDAFQVVFETVYSPGELTAIGWTNGAETGRFTLRSAEGPARLRIETDRSEIAASDQDLAYVTLTLVDAAGTVLTGADLSVEVTVSGAGDLAGLGSGAPSTEEGFTSSRFRTFDGRALAVVRPCEPGRIRVVATAEDCEPVEVQILVEKAGADQGSTR